MNRYEWREGYGLWDNKRGTYLLLGDDEHARILWAALTPDRQRVARAIAGSLGGNPRVGELPPSWMKAADAAIAAMGETP